MRAESIIHVPPSKLWQSVCGGLELPLSDYEHVISCPACEKLITGIAETLDEIANRYPAATGAAFS